MSTTSPDTLLYLTVDYITKNYLQLCEVRENREVLDGNISGHISLLGFKNDYGLPSNVCDLLLQRFLFNYDIYDEVLEFFTLFTNPSRCPLKRFSMGNVYHKFDYKNSYLITVLRMIIKCQNLLELEVGQLFCHLLFEDFLNCSTTLKKLTIFGPWSLTSEPYSTVTITHGLFFKNFGNLRHLSLNNCRSIMDSEVEILASEMEHLESLDLSSTSLSVIHVLGKLTTKLKLLIIHNTPCVRGNLADLLEFSNLRHLDISRVIHDNHDTNVELSKFLTSGKHFQHLTSLDVSGCGSLKSDALESFLDNHRKLHFLGLLDVDHRLKKSVMENLEVTGEESLKQVLACLYHYKNRPFYLTKTLKNLYNLSRIDNLKEDVQLRKRIIEVVLDVMRKYMYIDYEDLQTAASACLHNYIRYDARNESNSLHVNVLSDVVAVIIQILQKFPNAEQIHRNSLIVLYNKYILSAAKFNAYQLSDLLFKATILISERGVNAIALDMCAYLSSRISMEETLKLGTSQNIMKLLSIIRTHIERGSVDSILLCSLRVLWNLTDETPQTCHLVIENDGLSLICNALKAFDSMNEVLTKLLGVLNNLAEVVDIRPKLMSDELVSLLQKYLDMNYAMDVSYFAGGTLCNLILDWPNDHPTQSNLLLCVGSAVNRWIKVETVMVGYRTFKSFLPLLRSSYPDVQLWAIWAIHHVCSQKVERYGQLCSDEGVVEILRMKTTSDNRSDVRMLAIQALEVISDH